MKEYLYTHCISYYIGNDRINNLTECLKYLNTIPLCKNQNNNDKILYVIYCIYDELNDNIINQYNNYKNLYTEKVDIEILYRWNSGGTIQTMSKLLDYIIENKIITKYIGIWEDDSIFKNIYLLDKVQEYLDYDNIIVGCHVLEHRPDIEYINGTKIFKREWCNKLQSWRQCPWCKEKHIYVNNNNENLIDDKLIKWIDGALYLTTLDNLLKIKEKLVKFTLAPEDENYKHIEHGINYGEVGFPTRLHLNGFKFIGLSYDEHFKHLNENTIGTKTI